MKCPTLAVLFLSVVMFVSCCQQPEVDMNAEKTKIEEVVKNSIGWALTKDTALLYYVSGRCPHLPRVGSG